MQGAYNAANWLVDRHVASDRGGRVAIVCGDERLTYEDLQAQVWRAQHALEGLDVRPEERVVMVVNDEPAFPAWFLGCLRSGAVPVPLSTMLTGDELGDIVEDAVARVVVLSAAYADHLPLLAKRAPVEFSVCAFTVEQGKFLRPIVIRFRVWRPGATFFGKLSSSVAPSFSRLRPKPQWKKPASPHSRRA